MAKATKKTKRSTAAKPKSDHKWKRAPGGWTCTKCRMFRSTDNVFYPVGKNAIDGEHRKTEPKCEPTVPA